MVIYLMGYGENKSVSVKTITALMFTIINATLCYFLLFHQQHPPMPLESRSDIYHPDLRFSSIWLNSGQLALRGWFLRASGKRFFFSSKTCLYFPGSFHPPYIYTHMHTKSLSLDTCSLEPQQSPLRSWEELLSEHRDGWARKNLQVPNDIPKPSNQPQSHLSPPTMNIFKI